MKITIISDNQEWKNSVQRYLEYVLPELKFEKDVLLVDINSKEVSSDKRTDRKGIEIAGKNYDKNTIIILMSFETEESLKESSLEFMGLMSHSNVGFIQLPDINLVVEEVKRIIAGEKKEDATAFSLYSFEKKLQVLVGLQHNMGWTSSSQKKAGALKEAREVGLEGTDEEIIEQIRNWKRDDTGYFKDKVLEGIFVDALNTLFDSNWNLNVDVLRKINKLKEKTGKTIFIISDSTPMEVEKAKEKAGLLFKLLSKFALRGAILEIAIDDLSEQEFKERYNITSKVFINVLELQ